MPAQQAVVDHSGGPLLVLAGPGTGKTTTLVESVVERIERRGVAPDRILVLTFSRRAAADLRARIADPARPDHGHAAGHDLPRVRLRAAAPVRRPGRPGDRRPGPAGPAAHRARAGVPGPRDPAGQPRDAPGGLAGLAGPRLPDPGVRRGGPGGAGPGPAAGHGSESTWSRPARPPAARSGWARASSSRSTSTCSTPRGCWTTPSWCTAAGSCSPTPRSCSRLRTELGLGVRRRVPGHRPGPGPAAAGASPATGATWWWSATPTSRSTPSAAPRRAASSTSPTASAPPAGAPAPVRALATTRRFGPVLLAASRNVARRLGVPRALPGDVFAGFREPRPAPGLAARVGAGLHLHQPRRRGRAHRGDPAQRPPARRPALGRDGGAGPGRPVHDPGSDPGADRGRRTGRGGRGRDPARGQPGRPSAAAGPPGRGSRLCGHPGRGAGAAQLTARRDGQHGRPPARPGAARGRAGRAGRRRRCRGRRSS